jgi:drug/metabolite transporter (DMT)-like permease
VLYILGVLTALQLVVAQGLWKSSLTAHHFELSRHYLLSRDFVTLLLSPGVLIGGVIYVVATVLYFGLLAKYPYALVQSLILASSLIFAFLASAFIFHERIGLSQLAGLVLLIGGVWLITHK